MRLMRPCAPLALCLVWLAACSAPPASAQAIGIDKVLMVVNEEPLMLSEYRARHQREALQEDLEIKEFDGRIDRRILERMIDERIQVQRARRRGMRISTAEVEQAVALIAEQNKVTVAQLLARLAASGIAAHQFKASIYEQRLIQRLLDIAVNARVAVSDAEIANHLATHQELTAVDKSYEVSHIFIAVPENSAATAQIEYEKLRRIRQNVLDGESFAQFAIEFSDSAQQAEGGYLGWRRHDQLPTLFLRALHETPLGGVSEIIQSENGMHLLQVHDAARSENIVDQQLVRHILIRRGAALSDADAEQLADDLYARIHAGEAFDKIARLRSDDHGTAADGGLLGWSSPGEFPPEFEQAARALKIGEVSEPVRTRNGFHLLQVVERRRGDMNAAIAANRARQVIFQRKAAEIYENWRLALRAAAFIEYVSVSPS